MLCVIACKAMGNAVLLLLQFIVPIWTLQYFVKTAKCIIWNCFTSR